MLGMELLRQERTVSRVTLAADNVASILRSASTNAAPAQYIWDMFHDGWAKAKKRHRNLQLTIRWVPGHEGVWGNEEADRLAKAAVGEGSSAAKRLPATLRKALPRSKAALWKEAKMELTRRAAGIWSLSATHEARAGGQIATLEGVSEARGGITPEEGKSAVSVTFGSCSAPSTSV